MRAFSIAGRLISDAKICTGKAAPVSLRYSCNDMAIENASSPVAQPATQTRIVSFAGLPWRMRGKTTVFRASNDCRSRKKLVTLISKSRCRAINSTGIVLQTLAVFREAVNIAQGEASQDAAFDHLLPVP